MGRDSEPVEDRERYERLRSMAPSQKLVFLTLTEAGEPLDANAISERTLLAKRTVRYAVNELRDAGLIESQPDVMDARTRLHTATSIERPE